MIGKTCGEGRGRGTLLGVLGGWEDLLEGAELRVCTLRAIKTEKLKGQEGPLPS